MAKAARRTTALHGDEFEVTPARLSMLAGVIVQHVAASLHIRPSMSCWRKQAREGATMTKGVTVDPAMAAELKYCGGSGRSVSN